MKQLLAILLLFSTLTVRAQWDTAGLRLQRFSVAPALSATALMATGTIFTYNPVANSVALSLRDAVVSSRNPRLHFDDYIQYLPAALPLALNLCGVKGKHSFGRLLMLEGGSYLLGAGWLTAFKYGLAVQRPDGSTFNSFPSGHTFTAFTGAEIIRRGIPLARRRRLCRSHHRRRHARLQQPPLARRRMCRRRTRHPQRHTCLLDPRVKMRNEK